MISWSRSAASCASGQKAADRSWRVAVERPLMAIARVQRVIGLRDLAMATSGIIGTSSKTVATFLTYHQPEVRLPVQHSVASVSVVADDCAQADAWATALMALGERRGLKWPSRCS